MDMFDFMFPEQAEAEHLRKISGTLSGMASGQKMGADQLRKVVDNLGFLNLLLLSLVRGLVDKGLLTQEEILDRLKQLDTADGYQDGKLSPGVLRGLLGFPVTQAPPPQPAAPSIAARAARRNR